MTPRSKSSLAFLLLFFFLGAPITAQVVGDRQVLRVFLGEAGGDQFGWVSDRVPDLDGDGVDDLVVTATGHDSGGTDAGRVYAYSGLDGSLIWHADGQAAGQKLGHGLGSVGGDFDGDGVEDVVAGAPAIGTAALGTAQVLSGADGSLLLSMQQGVSSDQFGEQAVGVGDQDGDGLIDFAVTAPRFDGNGTDAGRMFVLSGAPGGAILWSLDGDPGSRLGEGLDRIDDLTGDGLPEVAVAAPSAGAAGEVWVVDIAQQQRLYTLAGDPGASVFGQYFVACVDDIDGDDLRDLLIGDYADNSNGSGSGKAYLFSGIDGARIWARAGTGAGEGFGIGRGMGGDLDGDDVPDLVIASWTSSQGAAGAGRAEAISGATGAPIYGVASRAAGEGFGFDAHGAGDTNGDGFLDSFVTAANWSGNRGRAYLISGCPGRFGNIGTPILGSGGLEPVLQGVGCPTVDTEFTIEVAMGLGATPGALVLSDRQAPTFLAGGILLPALQIIHPHFLDGTAGIAGDGSWSRSFPLDSSLLGLTFFLQAVYADAGAAQGLSMTKALQVQIR